MNKNEYMTLDEFRISRASRYSSTQDSMIDGIMSAWRQLTEWIRHLRGDNAKKTGKKTKKDTLPHY